MQLDKAINERASVRKFTSRKPNWRRIIDAIDAANKCPLAGNIPSLKFILVDDDNLINNLAEASQQQFIKQAKYVVIVCNDMKPVEGFYDKRAGRYAKQQAGAAIENFLLKITDLGLASCWVGAFVDSQVKRILNIPEEIEVEAILPVGYEMKTGKKKTKQKHKGDLDRVLYFNSWKNKYMVPERRVEA